MDLVEEVVPLADRELAVLRPRNSEALIDEHAFEEDEFMPYWAELWPSGVALGAKIVRDPEIVQGKRVLEIGCGLGVTAVAALRAGADLLVPGRVRGSDHLVTCTCPGPHAAVPITQETPR